MTDRSLVPKMPFSTARSSRASRPGIGFIDLRAVLLVGQTLVDLQERHDVLDVPQVVGRRAALDLAVHRLLEQDRAHDAVAVEGRAGDDAGAHLVHQVEHLLVAGVGVLGDAVELQRLRRAAAALVERGDEAGAALGLLELVVVHVCPFFFIRQSSAARIAMPAGCPNSDHSPVLRCHTRTDGEANMTATMHRAGIARRENGVPPPDVPLADIDLGTLEFWAAATTTCATARSRRCDASRRSPSSRSPSSRVSPRAPAIGRSPGSTTSTMPVVTRRSSARSRQARLSTKCRQRSRSSRVR